MLSKAALQADLKDAMRAGDEVRKRTLRMVLTAVRLAEVDRRGPLDEAALFAVLQKEAKMRNESIADAEKAGRTDLVEAARAELAILEAYLPQPLTQAELEDLARQVIAEVDAAAPGDIGRVMKALMPRVQGRADGKAANEVVRRLLSPS
jgi:hypothetical protein